MSFRVYVTNNPDNLKDLFPTHTVEAEWGDRVVEGSIATLAHHGPRAGNPAPCIASVKGILIDPKDVAVIGVSHVDLDTVGGIRRLLGRHRLKELTFWKVAAAMDTVGPHRFEEILDSVIKDGSDWNTIWDQFHAWWAWSENHRIMAPRGGEAADVTKELVDALDILDAIFDLDEGILNAGREWAAKKEVLEEDSFVKLVGEVILRRSEVFVNHLYNHEEKTYRAVVALNHQTGACTVSLEGPEGFSCRELVQELWGSEAGGHAGIAGSPRGRTMTWEEAEAAANAVAKALTASR